MGKFEFDDFFIAETVYHSSSLLSNLSSSWTSKPPLAVKYRLDTGSLDEPGGPKSLCSTLERLLAWEKKLYEEVKVTFCLVSGYFGYFEEHGVPFFRKLLIYIIFFETIKR